MRLIQLQLTVLYGVNAFAKSSIDYLRGDALMDMSETLSNFTVDLSGGVLVVGPWAIPVAVAAIASCVIEYFLAAGFWLIRRRWLVAIVGLMFHAVLTLVIHIFRLHLAAIFLYMAFLLPLIPGDRRRV